MRPGRKEKAPLSASLLSTTRKREEETLRRFATVVRDSNDAITIQDFDGRITAWNRGAELMYGYSEEEALAMNIERLTAPGKVDEQRDLVRRLVAGEAVTSFETQRISKDGRTLDVWMTVTKLVDEAGKPIGIASTERDTTERRLAEEESRSASLYARSLIEASLDPLVTISPDGKIMDVNQATVKVTGVGRERLIGDDFATYFTEPELARSGYRQVLAHGLVRDFPLTIRHASGRTMDVLYNAAIYRDEAGEVQGVFAAARDITERRRAEDEVRKMNAELEQRVLDRTAQLDAANKELEAFSYSVSHDLRAPLRHVQGYVDLLEREVGGQLSENGRRYMQTIADASREMGVLIDDLLAFARTGRAPMAETTVSLSGLAQESIQSLETATRGRNIVWIIPQLPAVQGDPAMLRQVLTNLLDNAIKYSGPRDPAEIELGCDGTEDGRLIFFVRDNGVGFDPQYAHKLFGVFQRLHRADEFEGTGIGLAIVRRAIARHAGRTWAEGAVDKGATFYFTLKADRGRAEERS